MVERWRPVYQLHLRLRHHVYVIFGETRHQFVACRIRHDFFFWRAINRLYAKCEVFISYWLLVKVLLETDRSRKQKETSRNSSVRPAYRDDVHREMMAQVKDWWTGPWASTLVMTIARSFRLPVVMWVRECLTPYTTEQLTRQTRYHCNLSAHLLHVTSATCTQTLHSQ